MPRILVVDDEDAVRAAIQRRLERAGYEVKTAESSAEAARAIASETPPFDIIVTDMAMEQPDSGLAVLREGLARELFTEVIVLTAYGSVANAVESMRRGAFDYLEKNVPGLDVYEQLVDRVADALERRRASFSVVRRLEAQIERK
jgi:DNA-binding NtrC family response regulator